MGSKNISGYELARQVLLHPRGGVDALLSLTGTQDETNWLELKAGIELLPEDREQGQTSSELRWNIAKAVIALMNTSGGIVLIGIGAKSDKADGRHAVIPLRSNDPGHVIDREGGLETYLRTKIYNPVCPVEGKKWTYTDKNKNTFIWEIKDAVPEDHVVPLIHKYRGEDIAVLLVKPAPVCVRVFKNVDIEMILKREPGAQGNVKEIKGSKKMEEYEKRTREKESPILAALLEKFLEEAKKSSVDGIINDAIRKYCLKFNAEIKKKRLLDLVRRARGLRRNPRGGRRRRFHGTPRHRARIRQLDLARRG